MRVGIDFRGAQCTGSGLRGIGRYTLELVNGLIDYAPDIDLVLFVRGGMEVPTELKRCPTVPVHALSWTDPTHALWTKIPKVRSLEALHRRHWRRAVAEQKVAMEKALAGTPVDILHLPSALDIGSYPLFDYPCPVVMTFLDAIVEKLVDDTFRRFRPFQQEYYRLQAVNLQRANGIVAISKASARDAAEEFGLDPRLIDVVYPAVSKDFGNDCPMPSQNSGHPYFLFCSVPDPHKNPEVVLKAFRRVPDPYRLIFVSPTESEFVPRLRALATEYGFADRFTITGYVSEDDLHRLFKHATALVSPSKLEGFGLPVAQAMRAGTPVITSNVSAQAEIAAGVGYLVNPDSDDELAEAMLRMVAEGIDQARITRGLERTRSFDADVVTQQLVECYRKVLERESTKKASG